MRVWEGDKGRGDGAEVSTCSSMQDKGTSIPVTPLMGAIGVNAGFSLSLRPENMQIPHSDLILGEFYGEPRS